MKKIESVQVAVIFKLDHSIVFTLGDTIKNLQQQKHAQVQMLNTPSGARPEAPRIIIALNNNIINIGLNRFDIVINIPNHINKFDDKVLSYCFQSIENIFDTLIDNKVEYIWMGLIFNLHYPFDVKNKRSIEMMTPVFDNIMKIGRKERTLASFNLQFGYQDINYFKNFTISGYETISFQIPVNEQNVGMIEIGITPDKIDESGIEIKLDINNRPQQVKQNPMADFSKILNEMKDSLSTVLEETGLKEVIHG